MANPSLPLSTVFNVSVFVSPAAAPGPTFNQGLIVGPSTVIPSVGANSRARQYSSLNAILQDGFPTNSPEYLAAAIYYGQTPQPTFLWIGRQDLTALQTCTVGSSGGTGYVVGDIVAVIQAGAQGGQLRVSSVSTGGVVTGLMLVPESQGTGYSIATDLATSGGSGTGLLVDITAIGETPLQAVQACRDAAPLWYICMFVGTTTDSDNEAIAAYIEGAVPASVYFLTTGDTAVLNNSPGNLLANLQAEKYRRTFSQYATTQSGLFPNNIYASAAPMGSAMGRNTGAPGSYFDLMFKPLAAIAPEPLTQTQVTTICGPVDRSSFGLCGNVYLNFQNGAYQWLQLATMASGNWFDEVLNLDMLAADMQTSGVNLLVSLPALPITEGGVAQMKTVISQCCDRAQSRGFIAPSGTWLGQTVGPITSGTALPKGYYVYAPPVSTLSQAQRSARQFVPITVLLVESQSAHSLSVTVDVQA